MSARAMVFAAGKGTRMMPLTAERPKPMVPVAGRPLIDHALDLLRSAGVGEVVINYHHKPEPLLKHLRGVSSPRIMLSDETGRLLDTGGGLIGAGARLLDGPILTMNADAVWRGDNPITALGPPPEGGGARLLLVPRASALGHSGQGDFKMTAAGHIARRGAAPSAPYVYTGVQWIDLGAVRAYARQSGEDCFSLNTVWDRLIADQQLTGRVYDGAWCDVGQPESIPLAEGMLADG